MVVYFSITIYIQSAFFANCTGKAPEPAPKDDVEERWSERVEEVDTVAKKEEPVKEEPVEEKSVKSTSTPSRSRTYSSSRRNNDYDNMRGFDPASEDDMDDNGMSRYMENDDDEGWD
jgi:predicted flap endonuclease-1-like 5' DNA nuclease